MSRALTAVRVRLFRWGVGVTSNNRKLLKLQGHFRGKRCYIVGNGPSLTISDLDRLHNANALTFGVNRVFLSFDQTRWRPTFYCVEDFPIIEGSHGALNSLEEMTCFFIRHPLLSDRKNVIWFDRKATDTLAPPEFCTSPIPYLFCGQTVIYMCLQLAYFLGFSEIILIGADFSWPLVADDQLNPDGKFEIPVGYRQHFVRDYMKANERHFQVTVSHYDYMSKCLGLAKTTAESNGCRILNATRGGKLEVFDRVALDPLLDGEES